MPFLMNLLSNPALWKALGIAALMAALFIGGCRHGEQNVQANWDAEKFANQQASLILIGVQDEITNQVIQGYIEKIKTIQSTTKIITKKVKVYVPANSCPLPPGFRVLHNAAVRNELPDPASDPDATSPTTGTVTR